MLLGLQISGCSRVQALFAKMNLPLLRGDSLSREFDYSSFPVYRKVRRAKQRLRQGFFGAQEDCLRNRMECRWSRPGINCFSVLPRRCFWRARAFAFVFTQRSDSFQRFVERATSDGNGFIKFNYFGILNGVCTLNSLAEFLCFCCVVLRGADSIRERLAREIE